MPNPEIDRRCGTCGASVRARALFCPQCGNPVANRSAAETAPTEALSPKTNLDRPAIETVTERPSEQDETQPLSAFKDSKRDNQRDSGSSTPPMVSHAQKPASDVATSRVARIRKVSSIVIDQAAYDPSLRFVLVAAGLFFLFLILLVLSKVIG